MKKIVLLSLVAVMLGGCGKVSVSNESGVVETREQTMLEDKLTVGENLTVIEAENGPVDVESYSVDLGQFNGQRVRIEGEYSGTTMFVDKVSVVE